MSDRLSCLHLAGSLVVRVAQRYLKLVQRLTEASFEVADLQPELKAIQAIPM